MEKMQIEERLKKLSGLREEKGRDEEALLMADEVLKEIKEEGAGAKPEAQLWLEKSLIWQHVYMNERNKGEGGDGGKMEEAKKEMEESIKTAERVMEDGGVDRGDPVLRIDMYLGQAAVERKDYQKAKEAYEKAIEVVKSPTNRLEFKMRLCEPVIMLGEIKEGVRLAQTTDEEFDMGVGEELKEKDYITWVIWKSGIWIRVARSLDKKGEVGEYKDLVIGKLSEMEESLDESKILTNKWAENPFKIRLDEIETLKKKIG